LEFVLQSRHATHFGPELGKNPHFGKFEQRQDQKRLNNFHFYFIKLLVYYRDFVGEFWTSGVNVGPLKNFFWTARDSAFTEGDTKWANGEPSANGDCVSLQLANSTEKTLLAAKNCADKKKFICEV